MAGVDSKHGISICSLVSLQWLTESSDRIGSDLRYDGPSGRIRESKQGPLLPEEYHLRDSA
ncbi:hypothetical protein PG985_000954 [Apiospora marii]|uniref:Uncharacterized protein n=1 Tax=Apiospora marii TaxID=335849 RepID=A0ABR1RHN4_9PEZI